MSFDDERWREFQKQYHQDMMQQRAVERRMEWHREDIERARKQARAELRDRFAMAALTGLLAHRNSAPSFINTHQDERARMAYEYADAMLKARGDE